MKTITINNFPRRSYAAAEAMNTLCTNLSFSGENTKKLMFTSCTASEGKSFVSMNVLRTMAQLGKRVVLVDADMRRSNLDSHFDFTFDVEESHRQGLAHYLAGMCKKDEILYRTDIEGAYLVPVGRNVSNPLPLLNSPRFPDLLDDLAKQADYVLVDAPPVGAVIDGAEIAKSCDGSVIVINYNAVHRQDLVDVKMQLEHTGCPILGTVLNRVPFDDYMNKSYYYKNHYDYRYTSGKPASGKGKKK